MKDSTNTMSLRIPPKQKRFLVCLIIPALLVGTAACRLSGAGERPREQSKSVRSPAGISITARTQDAAALLVRYQGKPLADFFRSYGRSQWTICVNNTEHFLYKTVDSGILRIVTRDGKTVADINNTMLPQSAPPGTVKLIEYPGKPLPTKIHSSEISKLHKQYKGRPLTDFFRKYGRSERNVGSGIWILEYKTADNYFFRMGSSDQKTVLYIRGGKPNPRANCPSAASSEPRGISGAEVVWVERHFSGGLACRSFRGPEERRIRMKTGDLFKKNLKPIKQITKDLPVCEACHCPSYSFMLYLLIPRERLEDAQKSHFKPRASQQAPAGLVLK